MYLEITQSSYCIYSNIYIDKFFNHFLMTLVFLLFNIFYHLKVLI